MMQDTQRFDMMDTGVTPAEEARLAALGMRVSMLPAKGAPPVGRLGLTVLLISTMGTTGTLVPTGKGGGARFTVDPILHSHLESATRKLFKYDTSLYRALPQSLTMNDYLMVFEKLADWLIEQGSTREQMGRTWALHCILALPPVGSPRNVKHVARAIRQLDQAQVPPAVFYETLHLTHGKKILERATAASIFRLAHPELHPSLALEMFA